MPEPENADEVFANLVNELYYAARPQLDLAAIIAGVQSTLPGSVFTNQGPDGFCIAHLDHASENNGIAVPIQTLVSRSMEDSPSSIPLKFLQQTFDWPGGRDAVSKTGPRLVVAELFSRKISPQSRVLLFNTVLRAVLESSPPLAISSVHARKLIDPIPLLDKLKSGIPYGRLVAHVNVRFHVVNGRPNEIILDTLGLGTLSLPDLQCHFQQLDPNRVAPFLFNAAHYVFTSGAVIQTGQFLQGLTAEQRWKCTVEKSLLPPYRPVIDLNPGPPFVAGDRPS